MDALDAKLRLEVSRPVTILEDTGELRGLAEQIKRLDHDPRRPGPMDFILAASTLAAFFVVGLCALILIFASNEYPVEPGRVVLTMAAAGTCVFPTLAGMFFINRANRRRFDVTMEEIKRNRCGCERGPASWPVQTVEFTAAVEQTNIHIGMVSAQIEQLDTKIGTYWNGYTAGVSDVTGDAKVIPMNGNRPG